MVKTSLVTAAIGKTGSAVAIPRAIIEDCYPLDKKELHALKAFADASGIENVCVKEKAFVFSCHDGRSGRQPELVMIWKTRLPDDTESFFFSASVSISWFDGYLLYQDIKDHLKKSGFNLEPFMLRAMGAYVGIPAPGESMMNGRLLVLVPNDIVPDPDEGVLLTTLLGKPAMFTI